MVEGRPARNRPTTAAIHTHFVHAQCQSISRDKSQLGETYLESRLGEAHLELPAEINLSKLTRVNCLQPLKVARDPYQVPVNLLSPPKSGPRHVAKCPTEKVSTYDAKEAEGSDQSIHRRNQRHAQSVSERNASNGEVQTTYPCTPTCPGTPSQTTCC